MPTNPTKVANVHTGDRNINQLQSNSNTALNKILLNKLINNNFLINVLITTGSNSINHLLGRMMLGWFITDIIGTYVFVVTSANAEIGSVYSNNTNPIQSFTALSTISSGTTFYSTGTGTPTTSGTLTKTSGTGDATITFSSFSYVAAKPFRSAPLNETNLTLMSDIPTIINLAVF